MVLGLAEAAVHAASLPRKPLFASEDWGWDTEGERAGARGGRVALNGGRPSEMECDGYFISVAGIGSCCGAVVDVPRFKDIDRRLLECTDEAGDDSGAWDDEEVSSSSSSGIPKSASPIRALNRLFEACTTVCADWNDSAQETGLDEREGVPLPAPGRMV